MHGYERRAELNQVLVFAYELTRESTNSKHLFELKDNLAFSRRLRAAPLHDVVVEGLSILCTR
jgi:hypothetical protein